MKAVQCLIGRRLFSAFTPQGQSSSLCSFSIPGKTANAQFVPSQHRATLAGLTRQ